MAWRRRTDDWRKWMNDWISQLVMEVFVEQTLVLHGSAMHINVFCNVLLPRHQATITQQRWVSPLQPPGKSMRQSCKRSLVLRSEGQPVNYASSCGMTWPRLTMYQAPQSPHRTRGPQSTWTEALCLSITRYHCTWKPAVWGLLVMAQQPPKGAALALLTGAPLGSLRNQ